MTTRMIRVMLAMVAMALGTTAQAGLLPVTVTVLPEGNNYRWTYAIVLPTDSQLRTGDYFTIYDFGGLVASSNSEPKDWAYTQSNVGPVPAGVAPDDNTSIPNLTWTYNGPTIVTGSTGLGNFWAVSQYQDSVNSFFTARTHRTTDGVIDTNITDTVVPVPTGPGDPNTVPEPMTLVMAGLGLPLVGLARAIRRNKAAQASSK
ncbi:hypothetical protein BH11PLA2_BH11PLA2_44110 [soil metagenome]